MLHCPLSFNHVFHRNLFPRSQRGELREKRCGLLPNRANFISFSGAPARRNGWTDFLRRKKLGIAEKGRREERGKMARDTGGIIVTSKTRDTPLLPPPQFSSKRTRRKVSSLVSVAHAVEIGRRSCKRKKLPQLHPQRSIRSQLPTSANSTFFEPRVRTISFQDLHPRGSHEGNSPRWHARFCSREQRTHPWRRVVSRSRTGYTRRRRSKVAGSRVASFQRNSIGRLPSRSSAALSLPVEFTSIYCVRVVVDRPRSSVYPRLDLEISIPCLFIRGSMRATRDRLDILGHTRRSGSIGRSCRSRFLFVICLVWMDWEE